MAAMHDLGLAARRCDRLYVLEAGSVVAADRSEEVLTTDLVAPCLRRLPGTLHRPRTGRPHLSFDRLDPGEASR
ncbi:MAG: hypothetical protein ACRDZO_21445 [Egibacteraceae bacterium]